MLTLYGKHTRALTFEKVGLGDVAATSWWRCSFSLSPGRTPRYTFSKLFSSGTWYIKWTWALTSEKFRPQVLGMSILDLSPLKESRGVVGVGAGGGTLSSETMQWILPSDTFRSFVTGSSRGAPHTSGLSGFRV